MPAILKHELNHYLHSLTTYLFIAAMLLFIGIGALLYNINSALANFEYVLAYVCMGMCIIIPILTMRIIAEERKQKTDQLLYSLPLTTAEIVIGKYLAVLIVFAVPCLIVSMYPLIFAQFGDVYLLTSYGSLLAFFIMSAAMVAIGVFISSLSDNIGFAAGIAIVLFLFNYFSVTLAEYVSTSALGSLLAIFLLIFAVSYIIQYMTGNENIGLAAGIVMVLVVMGLYFFAYESFEGLLPSIMTSMSLFERFYVFVDGVFDLTNIVFFLSVIALFLFLTVQSFEKRRYN